LQKAGFENAGALLGGLSGWESVGGGVVEAPPAAAPAAKPEEPKKP
jgi:hypothetical protein